MMKLSFALILVLAVACVAEARQVVNVLPTDFERGDVSEIKDKRRAFVSVVSPYYRENILQELARHKDEVEVVKRPGDADFIIAFAVQREWAGVSNFGPYREKNNYYARLSVYIRREGQTPRVLWDTTRLYTDLMNDEGRYSAGVLNRRLPVTKLNHEVTAVRDFVKALEKVRGKK